MEKRGYLGNGNKGWGMVEKSWDKEMATHTYIYMSNLSGGLEDGRNDP